MCVNEADINNIRVIIFIRPGIVLQIYPKKFLKTKPCDIILFIRRYVSIMIGKTYTFHINNHKIINLILPPSILNFLSSIKAEFH